MTSGNHASNIKEMFFNKELSVPKLLALLDLNVVEGEDKQILAYL